MGRRRSQTSIWNVRPDGEQVILDYTNVIMAHTQQQYDQAGTILSHLISAAPTSEDWTKCILPNIGLQPSAIASISKKNGGTFLKDMRFAKCNTYRDQRKYILQMSPIGLSYLVGHLNPARCHSDKEEMKQFSAKEYHFSVLIHKTAVDKGVIQALCTTEGLLNVTERKLTGNNLLWYFSDIYTFYHLSSDSVECQASIRMRSMLDRENRDQKQESRQHRQTVHGFPTKYFTEIQNSESVRRGLKRERSEKEEVKKFCRLRCKREKP